MQTLIYYNTNAENYVYETINVDFLETQERFLKHIPPHGRILDFGCGSGRDTKYFLEQGYHVDAMDGSVELCRLASEYTGINVKQMLFQDLEAQDIYDGIWACSSILHLPKDELFMVMQRMAAALKQEGIIYTSFKYGEFSGERNGRFFTDMTEDSFADFIQRSPNLKVEKQWITADARPGRSDEKWLNLILRKSDMDRPELSTLLRENTWSNNMHIISKTKSYEEKEFYLKLASKEKYKAKKIGKTD